jgi:DNA-binding NarL/FixJ family response regulator
MIRILIVDDHAVVREGLRMLLGDAPDLEIVGEAADGASGVAAAAELKPDVVLLDLVMPNLNGIEAIRQILARTPDCHILVLTSFAEDQNVTAAIQAGAIGYLLKDVLKPELLRAIQDAAQGKPTLHPEVQQRLMLRIATPTSPARHAGLTDREMEVLRLIASGHSNKQMADLLHLSEGTVKGYVSAILTKLGVADRTQAALYAVKHGLAPDT